MMGGMTQSAWEFTRSSTGLPDPATFVQRTTAWGAMIGQLGGAVAIVAVRSGVGMRTFFLCPEHDAAGQAVMALAQSVGAHAVPCEVPDLGGVSVGVLLAKPSGPARATQAGTSPNEVGSQLAQALPHDGGWLAVTIRQPSRGEQRRSVSWFQHRLGTNNPQHHSMATNPLVWSMFAGGASSQEVASCMVRASAVLPGFDVQVGTRILRSFTEVLPLSAIAVGGNIVAFSGLAVVPAWLPYSVAAVAAAKAGWLSLAEFADSPLLSGTFAHRVRNGLCQPKRNGRTLFDLASILRGETAPSYPLHVSSFYSGPSVIAGLASPHGSSGAGAATAERKEPSPALVSAIGPAVGYAGGSDQIVRVSVEDTFAGVGFVGIPGSGKSELMRQMWGWSIAHGADSKAMVAFESKGDGAVAYQDWSKAANAKSSLVDVGNAEGWAIDVFDGLGDVFETTEWFVSALKYMFGEESVGPASTEAIQSVMPAALCVTADIAADAGHATEMSAVFWCHTLLGGADDEVAINLVAALRDAADDAEKEAGRRSIGDGPRLTDLGRAVDRLGLLFGPKVTVAQRREASKAARNKLGQVVAAETWFSPQRRKVSWRHILDNNLKVVVNTGVSVEGDILEERVSEFVAGLLIYSLRTQILRHCTGWQSRGRSVEIYVDELALVAAHSPEVITWLRSQGRSYGVRPFFATQYPEQLDRSVRTAFLGFATMVWFAQGNPEVVNTVVADLALDGGDWAPSDVANLEPFTAIYRATIGQHRQPAISVRVPYFRQDRSMWLR